MTFVKWQQCYICYKSVVIFYMQKGPNSTIKKIQETLRRQTKLQHFQFGNTQSESLLDLKFKCPLKKTPSPALML